MSYRENRERVPCQSRVRGAEIATRPASNPDKEGIFRCESVPALTSTDREFTVAGNIGGGFVRRAKTRFGRLRAGGEGGFALMRITGGKARGIPLAVPKGDAVRPATDGMRQAVFSSLASYLAGARFLDLFAGSGAYGLEALSRGAAGGTFVEKNAKAAGCLRENIAAVCKSVGAAPDELELLQTDALNVPFGATGAVPDVVFIDPPYELIPTIAPQLFARLTEKLAPKQEALVVFELPGELELSPAGWKLLKRLGKGQRQPTAAILRRDAAG